MSARSGKSVRPPAGPWGPGKTAREGQAAETEEGGGNTKISLGKSKLAVPGSTRDSCPVTSVLECC